MNRTNQMAQLFICKRMFFMLLAFFCALSCITTIKKDVQAETIEKDKAMGDSYYDTMPQKITPSTDLPAFRALGVVPNPPAPSGTIAKGVDISRHNGNIDFKKLKENVDFVILRCGYGMDMESQDDSKYEEYVKGCVANKIPFGVYLYSYATTVEKAKSEAEHTIRLLKKLPSWGASLSLPVFYDMEDSSQAKVSSSLKVSIAKTYFSALEKAGYVTGLYANTYWWETYLKDPYFDTIKIHWVARYNNKLDFDGRYDIWQCSESAVLDGMGGNWDLDYMVNDVTLQKIFTKVTVSPQTSPNKDGATATTAVPVTQTIQKYNLSKCKITLGNKIVYTGKQIKPVVKISYGDKVYKAGSTADYTITYGSNKLPGYGTVTIKGNGKSLEGSVKKSFIIIPSKPTITSVKRVSKGGKISWKKLKSVSGYQVLYRLKGASSWKYVSTKNLSKKLSGLKKNRYYNVKVRSYITLNKKKYYGPYSTTKTWKTK